MPNKATLNWPRTPGRDKSPAGDWPGALNLRETVQFLMVLAALAFSGVSCKVGPDYAGPTAKIASQWTRYEATTHQTSVTADAFWWRQFGDPVLDQLITAAHRNNLSLQAAGVRILEARARLNKSIGNLFPQQQGISGGVSYSRLNDGTVSTIPGIHQDYVSAQILFSATWETDIWGKYRRGIESDRAAYLGSFAMYEDALVTITADVAAGYVNLRTYEERLRVAQKNVVI